LHIFEIVKQQIDFETTASHYGITFNRNRKALCPFHDDSNPSLHNYGTHGHCFVCDKSYNIIDLEAHFKSLSPFEAVKSLADRYRIELPEFKNEDKTLHDKKIQAQRLLERFCIYANKKIKQHPEVLKFLKNKGLTEQDIDKYRIGYVGIENPVTNKLNKKEEIELAKEIGLINDKGDHFKNRIIFPVLNYGKPVFLSGRAYPSAEPKYLHLKTSDFFTKEIAFAENLNKDKCVLVESITDAIAFQKIRIPSVALQGTNPGNNAQQRLSDSRADLYFALDADEAGKEAGYKLAKEFKGYVVDLGYEKDPDVILADLGEDEFKKRVESSINDAKYYLDLVIEKEEIKDVLSEIYKLNYESDKEIWLKKLSENCGIKIGILKKDLSKIKGEELKDISKGNIPQNPLTEYSEDEI